MSDRLLKESDVLKIAFQLPLVVNSAFADAVKAIPSADRPSAVDLSSVYSTAYKSGYEKGKADRPQGEWKHLSGDEWLCSECGYVIWTEGSWEHPLERGKDYCEHCGARMKG